MDKGMQCVGFEYMCMHACMACCHLSSVAGELGEGMLAGAVRLSRLLLVLRSGSTRAKFWGGLGGLV